MKLGFLVLAAVASTLGAACGGDPGESGPPEPTGPTPGELERVSFRFDDWGTVDLSAGIQHQTRASVVFNPIGETALPPASSITVRADDPTIVTCEESVFKTEGHVMPCFANGIGQTTIALESEGVVIDRVRVHTAVPTSVAVSVDRGSGFAKVDPAQPIPADTQTEIGFALLDAGGNRVVSECPFEIGTDPPDRYSGVISCSSADLIPSGAELELIARQRTVEPNEEPLEVRVRATRGP